MPAKLKKRGGVYHIVGTIRVQKSSVRIRETTGTRDEKQATLILRQRVAELERGLLLGEIAKPKRRIPNFASAAVDYIKASPHLGHQDRQKLLVLGEFFGNKPVDEIGSEDWPEFVDEHLEDRAPGTIRRWFAMFSAPMRAAAEKHRFWLPEFKLPREPEGRAIFLEPEERDGLLESYAEHAKPIAKMLCYQGCRHFEALGLDWRNVSLDRGTLKYIKTKNGEDRTMPIHPEVLAALKKLYKQRQSGSVFLTPDGKPYNNRHAASHGNGPDGAGIRRAHAAALRRYTIARLTKAQKRCRHCHRKLRASPGSADSATIQLITPYSRGGEDHPDNYALACRQCDQTKPPAEKARVAWFRVHDWRHHWASWVIMDGGDAQALMELGGWSTEKMVTRYVKLSVEHLRDKLSNAQRR